MNYYLDILLLFIIIAEFSDVDLINNIKFF